MRKLFQWRHDGGSRLLRVTGIAGLLALAFAAGSLVSALGDSAPATYSACLSPVNTRIPSGLAGTLGSGSLYNVTVNGTPHCQSHDSVITWNEQGPAGATGATGAVGATGSAGPSGPTGPSGPAGAVHDCDVSGASSGADYTDGNFIFCDLGVMQVLQGNFTGANFFGAFFDDSDFSGSLLDDANLTGSTLYQTNLTNATLQWANLTSAVADFTNFTGANLYHATTTDATFDGAIWSNTKCPDGTNSDDDGGTCLANLTP